MTRKFLDSNIHFRVVSRLANINHESNKKGLNESFLSSPLAVLETGDEYVSAPLLI